MKDKKNIKDNSQNESQKGNTKLLELITCSKTGQLSSMRLIALVGSLVVLVCIVYLVFSGDTRLTESITPLTITLLGLAGCKAFQANFERH